MTIPPPSLTLLKVSEYAARENISIRTVQRWIAKDLIMVERVGPTKRIRICVDPLKP